MHGSSSQQNLQCPEYAGADELEEQVQQDHCLHHQKYLSDVLDCAEGEGYPHQDLQQQLMKRVAW